MFFEWCYRHLKVEFVLIIFVIFNMVDKFRVKHLFCCGRTFLDLELRPYSSYTFQFKMLQLRDDIIDSVLPMQLKLTFNIILLSVLSKQFP